MKKLVTILLLLLIISVVLTSCTSRTGRRTAPRATLEAAPEYTYTPQDTGTPQYTTTPQYTNTPQYTTTPQYTGTPQTTDIYRAIEEGDLASVEGIVRSNPGIINTTQKKTVTIGILTFQCSPLAYAVLYEKPQIVEFLLKNGASVNELQPGYLSSGGQSVQYDIAPLHIAALTGNTNVMQVLVSNGGTVDVKNRNGETPLFFASSRDVATFLVERGANVNTVSGTGTTPLHIAAAIGNKDVVEVLLAKGANVNAAEYNFGRTPLHAASMAGFTSVVDQLVARGAEVNAKDKMGKTPLDYANSQECKQISDQINSQNLNISSSCSVTAEYLKQHGAR